MAKGNQRDPKRERRWRRHLRQQVRSRLTVRDYCQLHRLHESAFYFWRREVVVRDRQRNGAAGPTTRTTRQHAVAAKERVEPAFVPVTVVQPRGRQEAVIDIRLRCGDRLRVRAGCDRKLLAEVIAMLEGRPC